MAEIYPHFSDEDLHDLNAHIDEHPQDLDLLLFTAREEATNLAEFNPPISNTASIPIASQPLSFTLTPTSTVLMFVPTPTNYFTLPLISYTWQVSSYSTQDLSSLYQDLQVQIRQLQQATSRSSPSLDSSLLLHTPFAPVISACPLPLNFITPKLPIFNGHGDPQENLEAFHVAFLDYVDYHTLLAKCIPYRYTKADDDCNGNLEQTIEVLMITSQSGPDLLFPKGGWEKDEKMEEAASREAWEEAGVRGEIKGSLGSWEFKSKSHRDEHSPEGNCRANMFALCVNEELDSWPEKNARQRQW
ncbi:hypothetical protein KI387_022603, partial [Taxus chinensis]